MTEPSGFCPCKVPISEGIVTNCLTCGVQGRVYENCVSFSNWKADSYVSEERKKAAKDISQAFPGNIKRLMTDLDGLIKESEETKRAFIEAKRIILRHSYD